MPTRDTDAIPMQPPRSRHSRSRLASFRHALHGMGLLVRSQPNARIHLAATALAIGLAAWLDLERLEWALLCSVIALVLCAEALNTGIELVVDLASPEWHELARDAKDVAAAGVLFASLGALATGTWLLLPRLLLKLGWL